MEEEFREFAETWIRVVTVFLALELADSLFVVSELEIDNVASYFSFAATFPMLAALALFIGARDPRLQRFCRRKVIDLGVGLTATSLVFAALASGSVAVTLSGDLALGVLLAGGLIAVMCLFYPIAYYWFIVKKYTISPI